MKKTIAIIGSGPAALMLAATLDESKFEVSIYEQKNTFARKFLVAGDGGFNLTHSENAADFILKYTPSIFLKPYFEQFNNQDLITWLNALGIETYVGSSKRVFPVKSIKPIHVLTAIIDHLKAKNVAFFPNHTWKGWSEDKGILVQNNTTLLDVKADIVVFALGGKSWSITGSDGSWRNLFQEKNIAVLPFQASNCGYEIAWNPGILNQIEGKALKNISITLKGKTVKGEVVLTKFGIEGNAIYALSPEIRTELKQYQTASVCVDFKPDLTLENIVEKLQKPYTSSWTDHLVKQLNLTKPQLVLLKTYTAKDDFTHIDFLSKIIKNFPLTLLSAAPVDEAISTVGGVSLNEIDAHFQLHQMPHHYAIGEMLDWDAPTGGYLLQACFSMGFCLGNHLNDL